MAPARAIQGLFLAALVALLASQVAFVVLPAGHPWSLVAFLVGLVPSLAFSLAAERTNLRLHPKRAGAFALTAALFALVYAIASGTLLSTGAALAIAAALLLATAAALALALSAAPAPRVFLLPNAPAPSSRPGAQGVAFARLPRRPAPKPARPAPAQVPARPAVPLRR